MHTPIEAIAALKARLEGERESLKTWTDITTPPPDHEEWKTGTYSEAWRHRCEVFHMAAMIIDGVEAAYLTGLSKARGEGSANALVGEASSLLRSLDLVIETSDSLYETESLF